MSADTTRILLVLLGSLLVSTPYAIALTPPSEAIVILVDDELIVYQSYTDGHSRRESFYSNETLQIPTSAIEASGLYEENDRLVWKRLEPGTLFDTSANTTDEYPRAFSATFAWNGTLPEELRGPGPVWVANSEGAVRLDQPGSVIVTHIPNAGNTYTLDGPPFIRSKHIGSVRTGDDTVLRVADSAWRLVRPGEYAVFLVWFIAVLASVSIPTVLIGRMSERSTPILGAVIGSAAVIYSLLVFNNPFIHILDTPLVYQTTLATLNWIGLAVAFFGPLVRLYPHIGARRVFHTTVIASLILAFALAIIGSIWCTQCFVYSYSMARNVLFCGYCDLFTFL